MPDESPPTVNTTEARQGETSGRMRRVLGVSLTGAVIILAILLVRWIG